MAAHSGTGLPLLLPPVAARVASDATIPIPVVRPAPAPPWPTPEPLPVPAPDVGQAGPEPVRTLGRMPEPGTVAGIHVEQLIVWQAIALAAVFLTDAPLPVVGVAGFVALVLLVLTATRLRGQWTYRHLLHRARVRRHERDGADPDAPPPLTIQDARLGRRRRLASVFDGAGWSGAIRLTAADGGNGGFPLGPLVLAVERFLDDAEHDFAEVQIVHTLVPAGRTGSVPTVVGVQDRVLPPVVAQTWLTCRVHCVPGRRSDRPIPDLLEIRRDLRRAIDGVLGNLVEHDVDALALTTRQLYDDCVLAAGGRHGGPEPAPMPAPPSTAVQRGRSAGRHVDEVRAECEAVDLDYHTDLGDSVHAVLALDDWPEAGFAGWLRSLATVPARAISVVLTIGRCDEGGIEAGVVVRHTTDGPGRSAHVGTRLVEVAAEHGVGLRPVPVGSDEALLATLPLGSPAAHRLLGPMPRYAVEAEAVPDLPDVPDGPAGVVIGHDSGGTPCPVPLLGPDPVWMAVVGGPEVGAALVAAVLAADLPVEVVTPEPRPWSGAFHGSPFAGRLALRAPDPDGPVRGLPATPGVQLLDDYGSAGALRSSLGPWQAGLCRIDPLRTDVAGLLHGVTHVLAGRCGEQAARDICAALQLDESDVARFTSVPDGAVVVASAHGCRQVELDTTLLARLGIRVPVRARSGSVPSGPTINGRPMMTG